jgi:hypothetical protein
VKRDTNTGFLEKAVIACSPWQTLQRSPGIPPTASSFPFLAVAPPAASPKARAGLIEQQIRPPGDGFLAWPMSTRPAGPIPAGVTQGEET